MKLPVDYTKLKPHEKRLVREEYIRIQNERCYYCGADLDSHAHPDVLDKPITESLFPKGFFKYPVHLHHSHVTGMTIGAVHAYCNAVLWQYEGE